MHFFSYILSAILFGIIFFYISNWQQINGLVFTRYKRNYFKKIKDKTLIAFAKKQGVTISDITLVNSQKPFAAATSFPASSKPNIIISKKMYDSFSKDELTYIMLHECGHIIFRHSLKNSLAQLYFFSMGILLILLFPLQVYMYIFSSILGMLFGILFIQVARGFERETETYAAKNVKNSKIMISAVEKLTKAHSSNFWSEKYPMRKLLAWNIVPSEKIKIARTYGFTKRKTAGK